MGRGKVRFAQYKNRFFALVRHPFFWTLTLIGNSIILVGSLLLYHFESAPNNGHLEFLDCLLWSTGTVTTIGYGNLTPQTVHGKVTILILMFSGTLFVWAYMAFLVTGLFAPELASLEKNVHEVERELQDLRMEADKSTKTIQHNVTKPRDK